MAATGKTPHSALPQNLTPVAQLLLDLFDGQADALVQPFEQWALASKPFTAFGQTYLSKIRKKVRMSRDWEESYNLYCELRTAYLLLQEPKFEVAYEPYAKELGRSADFAVTFRTNTTFHVEVTRLRTSQHEQLAQQREASDETSVEDLANFVRRYESRRLVDVVCDKFGQLSAETPNVLWVWSESQVLQSLEIGQVMVELKRRIEQRDADLFARYGFGKPADFLRYYQRLSAILVQNPHQQAANSAPLLWLNGDGKRPLPAKVTALLRALVSADRSPLFPDNQPKN